MTNPMLNPAPDTEPGFDDTLSALLDGELSDEMARLTLGRLAGNEGERTRFSEYCVIGDALRGMPQDCPDLTARVMAALDNEPTVLAPMRGKSHRRPVLWLAAATTAALTWGLWQINPREEAVAPLAAAQQPTQQSVNAAPYLAAHQDFAEAVVSTPEMRFSRVSLVEGGR